MGLEATRITTPWKLLIVASVVVVMESASLALSSDLLASVQIVNLLPDQLQLYCKASERDLHPEVLPGNVAARFWWDFYPKIWFGRTVYYCNFKWAAASKWQYFVVWTEQYQECSAYCIWLVKPDGFWRNTDNSSVMKLVHPWLDNV